jgi:lactate permease
LSVLLAAAPPLVAAALLLARVSPVRASLAALLTGVLALLAFPVALGSLIRAEGQALLTGLEVVLIVLGGVLLFELMAVGGAHDRLGAWAARLSSDPGRRVLVVVLAVTPFAESVTGFGVGVIIAAPLLRRMGLDARRSATIALLGLVTVPWGALAPGTLVAARLGEVPVDDLGVASAVLSGPVFLVCGFTALWVALGPRAAARRLPDLVAVALALWVGIWGANVVVGTPLAGALGAGVALAAALGLVGLRERHGPPPLDRATARAVAPYGLLLGLLLGSRVTGALAGADGLAEALLLSPATWLGVTALATPALMGGPRRSGRALGVALERWRPVAVTTLAFLLLGGLMTVSGMASALAASGAGLGRAYLVLAPWLGGLGGFLTGSNAGANAMFAAPQAEAARALGYPLETLLAAQNVSASLLTMASAARAALVVALLGPDARGGVLGPVLAADAVVLVMLGGILLAAG